MHLFVPGGAGYVGSKLVPALLSKGHTVTVYDLYLYGRGVFAAYRSNPHLIEVEGDIRDLKKMRHALAGADAVIHLACISNDPSFELNPSLGKSINFDPFEPFVQMCVAAQVRRFIYASSSSVYGVKTELNVAEEVALEPLTDYSRFKAACEKVLLRYASNELITTILRPATVCGYAPRQRLDVVVNILTNVAYHTGKVKVTGGTQLRPNIHIDDMVAAYLHVLEQPPEKVQGAVFNVGYQNHSVMDLGRMVQSIVGTHRPVELLVEPTQDLRSYHISSKKIERCLGFAPKHTIEEAVAGLVAAFKAGQLPNALDDPRYFNIRTMKAVGLT